MNNFSKLPQYPVPYFKEFILLPIIQAYDSLIAIKFEDVLAPMYFLLRIQQMNI